jgi:hypothetical protein
VPLSSGFRAVLAAAALALVAAPASAQSADAQVEALTLRVEKLEGARAVKKLQRAFGYYVDRGLWAEAADLFADDGTLEIGADGVYAGKARIREYLKRVHGGQEGLIYGQLNEWVTLQPVVTVSVDGRSATARWRDLGMLGQYKKHAEWRDGIYENAYVKGADGIWRIKSLHLYVNFVAPIEKGWARLKDGEGLVRSEASKDFRPDRLSTAYRSFPDTSLPPIAVTAPAGERAFGGRLAPYERRVDRLEDRDEIENLTAQFGYYFDKGQWDQAAGLFTANGSFEYGMRGVYIGRDRVRRAMLLFGPQGLERGRLNNHMLLQPVIEVAADGRTGTGRFQGMVMLGEAGHNGVWGVGVYENRYVKEGGVWKIASLHFYPVALTDYDGGFMRSALPMEGVSALFPPDKPPSEVYRTYPANYIPPFSFDHPVTGKSLKDLPQPADDVVGRK